MAAAAAGPREVLVGVGVDGLVDERRQDGVGAASLQVEGGEARRGVETVGPLRDRQLPGEGLERRAIGVDVVDLLEMGGLRRDLVREQLAQLAEDGLEVGGDGRRGLRVRRVGDHDEARRVDPPPRAGAKVALGQGGEVAQPRRLDLGRPGEDARQPGVVLELVDVRPAHRPAAAGLELDRLLEGRRDRLARLLDRGEEEALAQQ
ncbi:MAG TPA: hypothetical protein VJG13_15090, partial [Thermoanaerobaculia bacterium]|nr:hypothetical protein [Thermoanaerobaculia bacterium]